ncbi:dipeptide/oligopeptide/nickel ABC transporter permease/ATP-binding protein [Inquilinus limosus]|uniref:dipeptide/oligopeptide/nickel ABC transporter permease/ATP-binding protein n=1 Tax=Inquilinus limosus TaxID=171674 RepID=UPI003F1881AA
MRRVPWIAAGATAGLLLIAAAAPLLGLADPLAMEMKSRFAGPSAAHLLGQDEYGRDVLSRLVWGLRTSLFVGLAAAALAGVLGTALGILGGYLRGVAEVLAIRSMDVVLCFPPLLLALLVVTLLGPGVLTLIPVLALVYLPAFTRVTYAGVLSARSQDYVEAMRAQGAGGLEIMTRTILPNVAGPILVQFSLATASAVVLESGLSFLGLGVVPPAPSLGVMIGGARATMAQAPLLLLWPCIALVLTILVLNALCDGLRDFLDPKTLVRRPFRRQRTVAGPAEAAAADDAVLDLDRLSIQIDTPQPIPAVRDVSLRIRPGETVAVVGESGSGKSLTSLAVMGLLPPVAQIGGGAVRLQGADLLRLDVEAVRQRRGRSMAMVFQDPASSLNPVHRVGDQIAEAIRAHRAISGAAAWSEAVALLRRVGIPDPERRARSFPHELSGGMRQRVMIAIAIANDPALLIADEPTTALDVTIQAQILDLLAELRQQSGMALLFVTHSLPVVSEIADRVVVMYAGEVVEEGRTREVFGAPLHPYTAALLASAPREDGPPPQGIPGVVPAPDALPPGCVFAQRCPMRAGACEAARPHLVEPAADRRTRCLRWKEL